MKREAIWLIAALATALGILLDMHRLQVNRVGNFGRRGWVLLGALIGPLATVPYLRARTVTRRTLIAAVWLVVGDETQPTETRRARLVALRDCRLIGKSVFRACLSTLEGPKAPTR